jgi:hypothetical protein
MIQRDWRTYHIDPKAIDVHSVCWREKDGEFVIPIILDVGIKPVREYSHAWPDYTKPFRSIGSLQEYAICVSTFVWRIRLVCNSWVDHKNLALIVSMQVVIDDLHLVQRKAIWIK